MRLNNYRYWGVGLIQPKKPTSYIDIELMNKTLCHYENNNLFNFLITKFETERIDKLFETYFVGTTKSGGTIFWQIDKTGNLRTGKIITYKTDGHRNKEIYPPCNWVHSKLKLTDFNLSQCLFGEHLLNDTARTVAIVESEKTALIASLFLPDCVWLATGGKQNFRLIENCRDLKGRKVVLFPDLQAFNDWNERAKTLKIDVSVSNYLETIATTEQRKQGLDLADFLIDDYIEKRLERAAKFVYAQFEADTNEYLQT